MLIKLAIGVLEALALTALPLFLAAGALAWAAGWVFIAIFMAATALLSLMLARRDPSLLAERLKGIYQRDQPWWDKLLLSAAMVLWVAWLALIGLDGGRFHWSHVPFPIRVLGLFALITSWVALSYVMRANSFLAPVVRLQAERGQRVISSGPYGLVRHPMYAAMLLMLFGTPLMLGSWWGLLGAVAMTATLVPRIVLEERHLREGLPGYADYAQRVTYRLVPLVW